MILFQKKTFFSKTIKLVESETVVKKGNASFNFEFQLPTDGKASGVSSIESIDLFHADINYKVDVDVDIDAAVDWMHLRPKTHRNMRRKRLRRDAQKLQESQ